MNERGIYNESEMVQRTCKFIRVLRKEGLASNRDVAGDKAQLQPNMQTSWDKCEGSQCAHWRWYRRFPWSKVEHGGLGFCGMAGKP
jgi:hypothetical protein